MNTYIIARSRLTISVSMPDTPWNGMLIKGSVLVRVPQRNRSNRMYINRKRFIIRNWLMQLWKLAYPKICRVSWQAGDTQRVGISVWVQRQKKTSMSHIKVSKAGRILSYLREGLPSSTPYSHISWKNSSHSVIHFLTNTSQSSTRIILPRCFH